MIYVSIMHDVIENIKIMMHLIRQKELIRIQESYYKTQGSPPSIDDNDI